MFIDDFKIGELLYEKNIYKLIFNFNKILIILLDC